MIQLPKLPRFRNYDLRFKIAPIQGLTLITFSLLLASSLFLSIKLASAQVPPPTVPCNQTNEDRGYPDEFHSLRPYQASPCSDETEPSALFCGNDLTLQDSFTVSRSQASQCDPISPDTEECIFKITRNLDIAVDVSGAELPIMGRTEDDVINSQNQNETRNDAEKVNEYVSWYLNGTNIAAEYGDLDAGNEDDISKLVNFSGPIKKLLPERIKRDEIRETIEARRADRHDQVVGCIRREGFLGIYVGIVECYSGGGGTEIRLSDLADHMPPQEEDPRFANYQEFLWAYFRWRGYECPNIPIVNITVCFEAPWLFNYWADLYYLTPLSSTEDRLGQIQVVNPYVQPVTPGMFIFVNSLVTTPAKLFFAHMEESQELADTLQDTFVPKGNPKSGPVSGVSPPEYCDLTEIRTNPGDDLFAGEIGVDLTYTADFSCTFDIFDPPDPVDRYRCSELYGGVCVSDDYDCDEMDGQLDCPSGWRCGRPEGSCNAQRPNPSCPATAQVVLNTVTKTPLVDDIWSRLVAGVSGVFKRIFPKVAPGAPVEGILDIPAATGVTYSAEINNVPVPVAAGNPGNQRGPAAELYFPHIGGIEQYFLQCIQTALRPQGFGEVCPSGEPPEVVTTCPSVPDSAIDSKWLGVPKQNYLRMANQRMAACPGPENNLAEECYNYVVSESLDEGVNPAFSLTMWFNESGASNYCTSPTFDFGIKNGAPAENIVEQLDLFLVQPFRITAACRSDPAWIEPMEAFLSVFHGNYYCDTSYDDGGYYQNTLNNSWIPVTDGWGGCGGGTSFGIDWPTDSSCP
ncbi:hypothetical protein A2V97_03470 [Candidatus Woesebacteria bacterium RBG_16_42_24]|uniref:Uncharacterized protein n=1 Tax=Candidatus Woesebacteria bacterium RBG_16_42_24 TaxID=1802485 RepID=A0A1F7XLD5_9BACT|nr:MAG: hypothetical protein A2V97_03470 [Candidatus Woesebacteria bacterium RBG_16_42_24]